ncbi:MAG TPA: nicotinate (nicotinamide) nucleotide adenylyltransferase [Chlamydiales bacterium]|nr:nicotinate (nicotinamide) nucleotide adenylyltransferase [Chlamydiales bacterium]
MSKKRLGIFGGSFDPIHLGHLNLAIQLKEAHDLDLVLFFPAYCSPFKAKEGPKVSSVHRLKMVKIAIQNIEGFKVHPFEIKKEGLSYTIDTVRMLQKDKAYGSFDLRLILSEEALPSFPKWRDAEELLKIAPPLIGCRSATSPFLQKLPKKFLQVFKKGITSTKIMEISSTEVRARLRKKLYCGHLLPAKVLDYIHKNRLY